MSLLHCRILVLSVVFIETLSLQPDKGDVLYVMKDMSVSKKSNSGEVAATVEYEDQMNRFERCISNPGIED